MAGVKLDIIWSPNHEDRFVTFGTDLSLYKVEPIKDNVLKPQCVLLSKDTCAVPLAVNNLDNQYMKCVAWYPKPDPDHLLAVGQANGKIILTSFTQSGSGVHGLIGKEFVPRHARQCNSIAWNPVESNLLAAGLDKCRGDHSLLVWDMYARATSDFSLTLERQRQALQISNESAYIVSKPLIELGLNETCFSLSWFLHQPKLLAIGVNNKYLKIFDLRDYIRHQNITLTKAVYGVTVDPHCEYRLASFAENFVCVWDTRNFEKSLNLTETRMVTRVAWCPTRYGLLSTLSRESNSIKLYDVQHTNIVTDEMEPAIIERNVQSHNMLTISSFAWHPVQENRMLAIIHTNTIREINIFERITINWSPNFFLVWACGKRLLQHVEQIENVPEASKDISIKMRQRALQGYGLKTEHLSQNADMVSDEPSIKQLWHWLDYILILRNTREEGRFRIITKVNYKFQGVKSILRGDPSSGSICMKSEILYISWLGIEGSPNVQWKIYYSEDREKAVQLCGWGGYDREGLNLPGLLDRLEAEGEYERAAAIALFSLKIRRAINTLNKGAQAVKQGGDINLNVVAMALSGFTEDKNALWREMCTKLRAQLQNGYLRAMFAFLVSDNENYNDVLNEQSITVADRVAFACVFLPDIKLMEFIDKVSTKVVESGNLDGVLLTGISKDGLDLLQQYVDMTGDVQTASLVVIQAMPLDPPADPRVEHWIESYRELLDSWRLWHQRAQFDVHRYKYDTSMTTPTQVFVSCNFCGKSISSNAQVVGASRRSLTRYSASGTMSNKSKVSSCPGCRKPLPRCALCLINMGTPSGVGPIKRDDNNDKLNHFLNWFTWCQSCRHGGHAHHIMEWFREHNECPVTACTCKCMSLDSVTKVVCNNIEEHPT